MEAVANGKLRLLLAYNKAFKCTGVLMGGAALCYKAMKQKRTPRRRSLAKK